MLGRSLAFRHGAKPHPKVKTKANRNKVDFMPTIQTHPREFASEIQNREDPFSHVGAFARRCVPTYTNGQAAETRIILGFPNERSNRKANTTRNGTGRPDLPTLKHPDNHAVNSHQKHTQSNPVHPVRPVKKNQLGRGGQTVSGFLGSDVRTCNQGTSLGPLGLPTISLDKVSGSTHFLISECPSAKEKPQAPL